MRWPLTLPTAAPGASDEDIEALQYLGLRILTVRNLVELDSTGAWQIKGDLTAIATVINACDEHVRLSMRKGDSAVEPVMAAVLLNPSPEAAVATFTPLGIAMLEIVDVDEAMAEWAEIVSQFMRTLQHGVVVTLTRHHSDGREASVVLNAAEATFSNGATLSTPEGWADLALRL